MAEEETSSRITELKARLEADPESRVFYQLGEELRKAKRPEEAETVLRQGLEKHPGYLSALISLGRVLKETSRSQEAIEILGRAFELDRQNVVVARLLGEVYAYTGEHVEAIKKYKLVAALHPADEEIQGRIAQLEQTLKTEGRFEEKPAPPPPEPPPAPPAFPGDDGSAEGEEMASTDVSRVDEPFESPEEPAVGGAPPGESQVESRDETESEGFAGEGGEEPEGPQWRESASDESPFAPAADADHDLPQEEAPAAREAGEVVPDEGGAEPGESDVVATITMADLYARQGHVDQARSIYRQILDREPDHQEAQERLESLSESDSDSIAAPSAGDGSNRARIDRLEQWLSKVRG